MILFYNGYSLLIVEIIIDDVYHRSRAKSTKKESRATFKECSKEEYT